METLIYNFQMGGNTQSGNKKMINVPIKIEHSDTNHDHQQKTETRSKAVSFIGENEKLIFDLSLQNKPSQCLKLFLSALSPFSAN